MPDIVLSPYNGFGPDLKTYPTDPVSAVLGPRGAGESVSSSSIGGGMSAGQEGAKLEDVINGISSGDSNANNFLEALDSSSASVLAGMTPREQLLYLIKNDPANSTAWAQALNQFDQNNYFRDSQVQNMVSQLEKNGINPVLAYNMISGYSPYVSSASASSMESARYSADTSKETGLNKSVLGILGVLAGILLKTALK